MRKPRGLFWGVFIGVLSTSLGAVVIVGLIARNALAQAFDAYLGTLPAQASGRMMGRHMLGAAEQTFIATVDRSVVLGAIAGIMAAIVAAYLIARVLTGPIRDLEVAVLDYASGDRESRVEASGPAEIVALSSAFNQMADSLSAAETLRRRLVADVAHELRNPIAAARAQSEGMAEGVLAVDRARLESVAEDMVHLSSLVDDLQELALAEAGELRYEMTRSDLAALVLEETNRVRALAPSDVDVRAEVGEGEFGVTGDARRLSEVLRNLLGNALRHTSHGSISVVLSREAGSAKLLVVDTGEGISDADLPYIFERLYRADMARTAGSGGAGLGLAISRRIVQDHGGEVIAMHTPGGGASVGFTLPIQ